MDKKNLRIQMLDKRARVSDRTLKDVMTAEELLRIISTNNIESLFVYVSMRNEVDTRNIIKNLIDSGKKVCIPYTHGNIMSVKVLTDFSYISETDKLGNVGGASSLSEADFQCDCAVVPLMAFNERLYRLGYGGGYYDKFLKDYNGLKIGLAYDELFCEGFSEEAHDVKMDMIITPSRVYCADKNSMEESFK